MNASDKSPPNPKEPTHHLAKALPLSHLYPDVWCGTSFPLNSKEHDIVFEAWMLALPTGCLECSKARREALDVIEKPRLQPGEGP